MHEEKLFTSLATAIEHWESMGSADMDDAESAADRFEQSFYEFVDVFRHWVDQLSERPDTVEELLKIPTCQSIMDRLPVPLLLNFETEAELIIDQMTRVEEDKYD